MSRTPPEVDRVAASQAAVAARRARSEIKRKIATREVTPESVLDRSRDEANRAEYSLRVTDFLLSIPQIGPTKLSRILVNLDISPSKRLGGLGRHQRERLREFLGEWAEHLAG